MGRTWMECPSGGLGWDALAADLDGIPLQQTWMECPSGRLGWDALVVAWGGLGWNALVADLDGMPLKSSSVTFGNYTGGKTPR